MILIEKVRLIDTNIDLMADVLIQEGKIVEIAEDIKDRNLLSQKVGRVINAKGKWLMPSFVDLHFHMRVPGQSHKETLLTGSKAAIRGGFTHLLTMANTTPPIDRAGMVDDIIGASSRLNLCQVFQSSTVTKGLQGKELVDFLSIRPYTRFFTDDGKNIDDVDLFKKALEASARYDFILLDHSEPETEMVIRNIKLVKEIGGNLHFCHVSKKESMEAIIRAKEKGLAVTVEVTPHHLYQSKLTYRVNPPFATEPDRLFLINAIKQGYVDAIATDHAPHTVDDKEKGSPGISGTETAFSLVHQVFKDHGISMKTLSTLMSFQPSQFLGIPEKRLSIDMPADLVLIEEKPHAIKIDEFLSKGKNTPFAEDLVSAKVVMTIKGGEIKYESN